jgi:hypothetical protein
LVLLVHGMSGTTSTSSLTVGTGSKSFTTPVDVVFKVGARVRASSQASPATFMEGIVTAVSQDATGGTLTINVDKAVGSGTIAAWNINIAGDPGSADFVTVRKFLYTATAGQTIISGTDVNSRTLAYTPGYITVVINGSVLTPADFTATDGASVVLPRGLSMGDSVYIDCSLAYNPADTLAASQNGADVADKAKFRANIGVLKKNYIVNGGMQVNQENPGVAGSAAGFYPVDQFKTDFSNGGAITMTQAASRTPGGSPNRLRVTVTAADASVTATDYFQIVTALEGSRVADLNFGTASSKTVTLQFGVKAPAGTYCVSVRNGTTARSYIGEFTILVGEANTDVIKSISLQGDTAGTWAIDNTSGMTIAWILMAGATYQTPAGAWTAGNLLGSSNQFNFMGTNGNVFELFDVGLYEGSAAPAFQLPDFPSELMLCKRYYRLTYEQGVPAGSTLIGGAFKRFPDATTPYNVVAPWRIEPPMRATPTGTMYAPQSGTVGKIRNMDSGADLAAGLEVSTTWAMAYVNNVSVVQSGTCAVHIVLNARM